MAAYLVPVDLVLELMHDLFAIADASEKVEEMSTPLVGSNGCTREGCNVRLDVWQEDIETSDETLEVQEEVGSLWHVSMENVRSDKPCRMECC